MIEAHLTNASKAERDASARLGRNIKFAVVFVRRGVETYGEALAKRNQLFVGSKREARDVAKANNATPWNF